MAGSVVTFWPQSMNKKLSLTHILFLGCLAVTQGQVIDPASKRGNLLDQLTEVISNTERETMEFSQVNSPFVRTSLAQPVVSESAEGTTVDTQAPQTLSDAVALQAISQQFRPLGSLVLGERGLLQLANGRTIEQGRSFNAEIRGNLYEVTVEKVTQSGYTLRLGGATVERNFSTRGN